MAKKKVAKIEVECDACGASGVYCGFAEPKGVGVVCLECGGSGKQIINFTPFTVRRRRKDVKTVRFSRGALVAVGVGPVGGSVKYEDFLKGKLPTDDI